MPRTPGSGKLRIGDHWNAIRIIALSQSNPLKAIAEFVENSIDAQATEITIIRGKIRGVQYLKIVDNGYGVSDFTYVATHIGDSIKRKLKRDGATGIQGEFGIGLLSFWTMGEELTITSRCSDEVVRKMVLVKDSPAYSIRESRELFDRPGTTVNIQPLLSGVRVLSGEKIQSYLASELRDRIGRSGVTVRIIDRTARKELIVVPRQFHGTLLHDLPTLRSPFGEIYVELYLTDPSAGSGISLQKSGTRVIADILEIEGMCRQPWTAGYLEGIIDCDFLNLTPGTRSGIVYDERYDDLDRSLESIEPLITERIDERRRAEEEEASRSMLRRITKALREAISMLPDEHYGWLSSQAGRGKKDARGGAVRERPPESGPADAGDGAEGAATGTSEMVRDPGREEAGPSQLSFFDMPGPLYRASILPGKATVAVGGERTFAVKGWDRSRRGIDGSELSFSWRISEGAGTLEPATGEFAAYRAPNEPELAVISVTAVQESGDGTVQSAEAEALITVTAELIEHHAGEHGPGKGFPGYTFAYLPGKLWRSRYSEADALITINNGHPDFVHASRQPKSKLRYIARLYAKEIVLSNFPGIPSEELLERLVELSLYIDESLR